jgi:hypothetical protein
VLSYIPHVVHTCTKLHTHYYSVAYSLLLSCILIVAKLRTLYVKFSTSTREWQHLGVPISAYMYSHAKLSTASAKLHELPITMSQPLFISLDSLLSLTYAELDSLPTSRPLHRPRAPT